MMACRVATKKKKQSANLCEQYRPKKKKKLDSSACMLKLRSCTHLEQNDAHIQDADNEEQVGITWMNMAPFVDYVPKSHSDLADVISVPEDILHLDSLSEVLSYEVWIKYMTESERELLTRFLPSGTGSAQAVRSLLMGENHHFGNPFHRWSTSLCAGNLLHPNAIRHMSHELKTNRRTYYSELNKYHTGMLDVLVRWKERWIICKDPETLLSEGPIKHDQNSFSSKPRAEGTFPNSTRKNKRSSQNSTRRLKAPKGELPPIICIHHNGSNKHTSHIKISTKQYKMIKKLKPSSSGITTFESLSHVLGDIKFFHANKLSEEEEEKRVHERWAQLATKDIPAAFKYCRDKKLEREKWGKSLEQELAEKRRSIMDTDEKRRNSASLPQEQVTTGDSAEPTTNIMLNPEGDYSTLNSNKDSYPDRVLSLHARQELSHTVSANQAMEEVAPRPVSSPHFSHFLGKKNPLEDAKRPVSSFSFPKDGSQANNTQDFFYQATTVTHKYVSTAEISLNQPRPFPLIQEHSLSVINMEKMILEEARPSTVPFPLTSHSHGQHTSLMTNNSFLELGQFPHEFQGLSQVREKDLYMDETMHTSTFRNGRYPGQGSYNSALVGHNRFPGEGQACNGWSEVSPSVSRHQDGGSGSGCSDGTHYGIPFGCNMDSPLAVSCSEQFAKGRNYTRDVNPDCIHKQFTREPKDIRSFDLPGNSSSNNVPQMYSLNRSPGFLSSIGRTFPSSWNQ